jgi:hypothetical protein
MKGFTLVNAKWILTKRGKTPTLIIVYPSLTLNTMNVIQAGFEPTTHALEGIIPKVG